MNERIQAEAGRLADRVPRRADGRRGRGRTEGKSVPPRTEHAFARNEVEQSRDHREGQQ